MGTPSVHADLLRALRGLQRRDGGFSVSRGGLSEVEPTAIAALALGRDPGAQHWLRSRQEADGGFRDSSGRLEGPTSAALAALALDGHASRRALAYAVSKRGLPPPEVADQTPRGWGWTADTRSFVEPTSRVLIAAKRLTPGDAAVVGEATDVLGERQCTDGGWNHGIITVLDKQRPGYVQTTALALIALEGSGRPFVEPGLEFLRREWRRESGGLTTAQTAVAFRLHRIADEVQPVLATLQQIAGRRSFLGRTVGLAWATLATGPDDVLEPLRRPA
jgi:hypothetical protein